MLVFKDVRCVRLGHHAHLDSSSGVTLWPISGQQPVYVTRSIRSWNVDGGKTKKVPGARYLILGIETQEKAS